MIAPNLVIHATHTCDGLQKRNDRLTSEGYVNHAVILQLQWNVVEMDEKHCERRLLSDVTHCPFCGQKL